MDVYIYLYLLNHVILCQTDTASVLSEAIEYIKFLHEQVSVSPIKHLYCIVRMILISNHKRIPCFNRFSFFVCVLNNVF
jgi:flagellar biosynthesis regulator FlbT